MEGVQESGLKARRGGGGVDDSEKSTDIPLAAMPPLCVPTLAPVILNGRQSSCTIVPSSWMIRINTCVNVT